MQRLPWMLDLLLVLSLIGLSAGSLAVKDLFTGVALFIAFGLLMALTWARLGTVDIALAEAAIGAGMTGVLLMLAMQCTRTLKDLDGGGGATGVEKTPGETRAAGTFPRFVSGSLHRLLLLLSGVTAGAAVWALPRETGGLTGRVEALMRVSGVDSFVTAVLLNFRGYDTLLELAVLLMAAMGVQVLRAQAAGSGAACEWGGRASDPVLMSLIRVGAPSIVFISVYLLWLGSHAPGGAFQGGALLGAGSVLLFVGAVAAPHLTRGRPARVLLVAGLAVFVATGLGNMLSGGRFLEYPLAWAKPSILLIETAAMLSIAAVFAVLFSSFLPGEIQSPEASFPPEPEA